MKNLLLLAFLFCSTFTNAQISFVKTGTKSNFYQIKVANKQFYVFGDNAFIAKCKGDCDSLIKINPPASDYPAVDFDVTDTNHLYLLGSWNFGANDLLYGTSDGGKNWYPLLDTQNVSAKHFVMFDSLNGVIDGTPQIWLRTIDGGKTWLRNEDYPAGYAIVILKKYNDSIVCVGGIESFGYSSNKGRNWNGSPFVTTPRDIFFLNQDTLVAISAGNGRGIYFSYTVNRGDDYWKDVDLEGIDPYGVYFKSINEGYIVGKDWDKGDAVIWKTTNLGKSWTIYHTGLYTNFGDIQFINDSIALITGSEGKLIKWNSKNPGVGIHDIEERDSRIEVYPNPAASSQTITIEADKPQMLDVSLYDISGKFIKDVFKGKINQGENEIESSLETLPNGIYTYTISSEEGIRHLKTIKL